MRSWLFYVIRYFFMNSILLFFVMIVDVIVPNKAKLLFWRLEMFFLYIYLNFSSVDYEKKFITPLPLYISGQKLNNFLVKLDSKNVKWTHLTFLSRVRFQTFPLLDASPWPLFVSFSVFILVSGFAGFFNFYEGSLWFAFLGFCFFVVGFKYWVASYSNELVWLRDSKWIYRSNLSIGFLLFIISEIMFFFSFFWGFFHSSIEPVIQIGGIWPPVEGLAVESLSLPIFNTIILLVSAFALTLSQFSNLEASSKNVDFGFYILFFCAFSFLLLQHLEYKYSFIQVCDSVWGSTLYILTSFHGLHVIIGTIYLLIVAIRYWIFGNVYPRDNKELIFGGWYWHFVDVVWIWVVLFIYIWPWINALS